MNEFEKWLKGKAGIGWYTGAEEGWKAALEMVLGASQCSGDSGDVFWDELRRRYTPVGCDVRDVIREELKHFNQSNSQSDNSR